VRSLLLYLPPRNRHEVQKLFEDVEEKLGAFVRGQIFLCLAIAVLALIAYLVIGLPNALVLSLIAGLLEAVPIFGPALGAIPAILVAFAYEPTMIIWVIAATALIQLLENYLLVPRVMGSTVGVNPILTLLVLTTLSTLLGLPGALLAIPSAAIIQLVLNRYVLSSDQSHWPLPVGRDRTSALRYEVQDLIGDVRKQLRRKDDRSNEESDQIEDSIESVALELDIYLKEEIGEEPAL
jgi:predicted PurR-regulated permease PerM